MICENLKKGSWMEFENKKETYIFVAENCEIDVGKLSDDDKRMLHKLATDLIEVKHFEDWGLAIIAAFLIYAEEQDFLHAPSTPSDSIN